MDPPAPADESGIEDDVTIGRARAAALRRFRAAGFVMAARSRTTSRVLGEHLNVR